MKKKTSDPLDKLAQIAAILDRYETEIDQAVDDDCEWNSPHGNGVNCYEANATFSPLAKDIREILKAK